MSVFGLSRVAAVAFVVMLLLPCRADADQTPLRLAALGEVPVEFPASLSSDIFDSIAAPDAQSTLAVKWRNAERGMRADADAIEECRVEPQGCVSAAAVKFLAIADTARSLQGRARIGEVNRAVNLAIVPTSDMAQHGLEDVWSAPLAIFASGRGDCEDYAIVKIALLRAAGIAADDLRLLVVDDPAIGEYHAVAAVRLDGHWLILDNRRFTLIDVAYSRYRPLYALRQQEEPAGSPRIAATATPSGLGVVQVLL
jgi:predicted transglutaminase-like cysteine proteinase